MGSSVGSRKGAKARRAQGRTENGLSALVVEEAMRLHRGLGPGLLENVYETILSRKLEEHDVMVRRQVQVPLVYEGIAFDAAFRADIIADDKLILEIKAVEKLNNAHRKQMLTYLKLTGMRLGMILDFSSELMKHGIVRVVNELDG